MCHLNPYTTGAAILRYFGLEEGVVQHRREEHRVRVRHPFLGAHAARALVPALRRDDELVYVASRELDEVALEVRGPDEDARAKHRLLVQHLGGEDDATPLEAEKAKASGEKRL